MTDAPLEPDPVVTDVTPVSWEEAALETQPGCELEDAACEPVPVVITPLVPG